MPEQFLPPKGSSPPQKHSGQERGDYVFIFIPNSSQLESESGMLNTSWE